MIHEFAGMSRDVLNDIGRVLESLDEKKIRLLVGSISSGGRVYAVGAGRSLCVARAFAIRLFQCGLRVFAWGDAAMSPAGPGDVLFACSSSGETAGVLCAVSLAKAAGCEIACVTSSRESSLAKAADTVLCLDLPGEPDCRQPLGSLFEQSAFILLDCAVKLLMEQTGQDEVLLARRHSNLE